ncbi:MAG: hypothetical protein NVSMB43_05010 [Pseudarthrobacter sp.]
MSAGRDGYPALREDVCVKHPAAWELARTTSNRRLGAAMVVRHGLSIGAMSPDGDTNSYVDALWVHNDPALYRSLVLT